MQPSDDISGDETLQTVQSVVTRFMTEWSEVALAKWVAWLPASDSNVRLPMLIGLIQADLVMRWRNGQQPTILGYLDQFPELGSPAHLPDSFVRLEWKLRQEAGLRLDLDEFAQRYGRPANELNVLFANPASERSGRVTAIETPVEASEPQTRILLSTSPNELLQVPNRSASDAATEESKLTRVIARSPVGDGSDRAIVSLAPTPQKESAGKGTTHATKSRDREQPKVSRRVALGVAAGVAGCGAIYKFWPTRDRENPPEKGVEPSKQNQPEKRGEIVVRKPGETVEFPLPGGLKMAFCWIPPGTEQLGSPKAERDAAINAGLTPAATAAEREEERGQYRATVPFVGFVPTRTVRGSSSESPSLARIALPVTVNCWPCPTAKASGPASGLLFVTVIVTTSGSLSSPAADAWYSNVTDPVK